MSYEQLAILVILSVTVILFVWGRWRHDIVALVALLASVFAGLVAVEDAFYGLGHPAVITVACVLVLSTGLQSSGAVDVLTQRLLPKSAGFFTSLAALVGLGALLSSFMNNVGAMALLMPVAVQMAAKHKILPGKVLMPLSFGTILGGMTTLIGTPPNLIVSGFRNELVGSGYGMFAFAPVGASVAVVGILFLIVIGWRLVPFRKEAAGLSFDTGTYLTEARIQPKSKAIGRTLREVEKDLGEADAQIVGMVRNDFRIVAPYPSRVLREGDILVIEADPEALAKVLSALGLKLEEAVPVDGGEKSEENGNAKKVEKPEEEEKKPVSSEEIELQELAVMPSSALIGRSAGDMQLRSRYSLNLLAISRRGRRTIKRLRTTAFQAGDVILMQGGKDALNGFMSLFGCVPLASRSLVIPDTRHALLAMMVMLLAIVFVTLGLLPAALAFAAAVLLFVVLKIVSPGKMYESIDWSIILLLGALIPVAGAMGSTGAADLVAKALLEQLAQGNPVAAMAILLVVTMTLSDFMNNAATAAVMCPIAISSAAQLGVNPDSFLMAVAVGASCAFLTPIGHQNNTLILGPGGFRFGDYWRMGLPMEILVVLVGIPMLLWVWPL